jgi:short-subunit dehydrogenase
MEAAPRVEMNQRWYEGKTALIAGASSSLGKAFAKTLAALGTHLILLERSPSTLHELAATLSQVYAVQVDVLVADLGREGAARQVSTDLVQGGRRIDILVNNTGLGGEGTPEMRSSASDPHQQLQQAVALVELTSAFLPGMHVRGRGLVINVVSAAAFQPAPPMPVSSAVKAFVFSFSQALRAECRESGVRVVAVCPDHLHTSLFGDGGPEAVKLRPTSTPEWVVKGALRAAQRGQGSVVPGRVTPLAARYIGRLLWGESRPRGREGVLPSRTRVPESEVWL